MRYVAQAPFEDVASFYEKAFAGEKWVFKVREEEAGQPRLVMGAGVKYTGGGWAAIVVSPAPPRGKRPGKGIHVIVTAKADGAKGPNKKG